MAHYEWFLRNKRLRATINERTQLELDDAAGVVNGERAALGSSQIPGHELAQPLSRRPAWRPYPTKTWLGRSEPEAGWGRRIICADRKPEGGFASLRRSQDRTVHRRHAPVISGAQLRRFDLAKTSTTTYAIAFINANRTALKIFGARRHGRTPELLEYGPS